MNKLDPCPFCGETPTLPDGSGTQYEIECDCGMASSSVQISDLMTIEERENGWIKNQFRYQEQYVLRAQDKAIKQWNTRHDNRS